MGLVLGVVDGDGVCPHRRASNVEGKDSASVQVHEPETALHVSFVTHERKLNVCADVRCWLWLVHLH